MKFLWGPLYHTELPELSMHQQQNRKGKNERPHEVNEGKARNSMSLVVKERVARFPRQAASEAAR